MKRKAWLYFELISVFYLLPIILVIFQNNLKNLVIPIILGFAIIAFVILSRDKSFDRKRLFNKENFKNELLRIIKIWFLGGLLLIGFTYLVNPDLLFYLPRTNPKLWIVIMIFYPLFSVYPQELIFRGYFFHRYKPIVASSILIILLSGISFGFAHIIFKNYIAPILSTFGGLLFAQTYKKSDSILLASIEHALWGDLIFTIGLGYYFYSGNI